MFINLHLHSNYSWDCVSKINKIVKKVKANGQTAVAVTDHGNMSGAIELYKECEKAAIKPIFGNEMYICKNGKSACDRNSSNKELNHIVILAKNKIGYKNLLKLTTLSNMPAHSYYKPRIDEEMLFAHKEGLIVINGHYGTSIFDTLFFNLNGAGISSSIEEAGSYFYPDYEQRFLKEATKFAQEFGDSFYVECQLFDQEDPVQQASGLALYKLAQKHGFQAVGTGDSHYISAKDSEAHKTFVAIKQNTKVSKLPDIRYLTSGKYTIIDNKTAQACYPEDLIRATNEIADKIESFDITNKQTIPLFMEGDSLQHLKDKCLNELDKLNLTTQEYIDRLNYEIEISQLGGLQDYFLIVNDYVDWARKNKILIGAGRGCLSNTNVYTKNGTVDISAVNINDYVITKSGKYNKVINKFEYDIKEECLKIKVKYGDATGITATKDHKILILKPGQDKLIKNAIWAEAKNLEIGDLLYTPVLKKQRKKKVFNLISFKEKKDKTEIKNGQIYHRINKNLIRIHPENISLDEDLAYLLGLFTGDGWLTKGKNTVCFIFNSIKNVKSQHKIETILTKYGFNYSILNNMCGKKANRITCHSTIFANFIKHIYKNYQFKAETKSIPEFIFNSSEEIKWSFLNGYLASDGSIKANSTIEFSSISKKLIYQAKLLLSSLKIPSGVYSANRSGQLNQFNGKKIEYNLYSYNFIKDKKHKLTLYAKNGLFLPIKSIEKVSGISKVYDIQVENESNYLTTSGIVHNSAGGSLIAFLLKTTSIDPIKYNLSFDRFYNKNRAVAKVLPDQDIDFPATRRDEVVDYLRSKYGEDKVSGVVTFNTLQGKAAIKDVLRVWGACDLKTAKDISDLIVSRDKISDRLAEFKEETGSDSIILYMLTNEPDILRPYVHLNAEGEIQGELAKYFGLAVELEGAIKAESKHASAFIIANKPITESVPMIKDKNSDNLLCAYNMYSFETAGLVKFDLLSLKSLDGLTEVNKIIKEIGIC